MPAQDQQEPRWDQHGPACALGDETHVWALADSGWWCQGCKKKRAWPKPPLRSVPALKLPEPSCPACRGVDRHGLIVALRADSGMTLEAPPR
jgi:hypothetical protein